MLKKHNKLIMLLVLVTFMFTIVGSAGAATTTSKTFSDVDANTVEASAIYRLAGLGILEGYPDGTFGADNTITRAEFAKIAVYTAGLQDVASGMVGVATGYPDVASDHWASGWINVASAQGFMKGYPDGSFGAEGQITQAEVITVLLRLLGYNDNLPGVWPSNYVSKAANMDILDDVVFVSNQPAVRGEVAIMASETLNCFVVEYKASDNTFEDKKDPNGVAYKLLGTSFKDTFFVENALAYDFEMNGDEVNLEVALYTNDSQNVVDEVLTFAVADSCVFSGGSILDVYEHFVEFDVNKDNKIISISVQPYGVIGPIDYSNLTIYNEIEVDSSGKADLSDYDKGKISFIKDATQLVQFGASAGLHNAVGEPEFNVTGTKVTEGTYDSSDVYKLVLNRNGEIAAVGSWLFPTAGIVERVTAERIYFFEDAAPIAQTGYAVSSGDFRNKEIFVQRDGVPVELEEIQALDTVVILDGVRGVDYYVIAQSTKVPGTLEAAEYTSIPAGTSAYLASLNINGLTDGEYVSKVKVLDIKWNLAQANLPAYMLTDYSMPIARVSFDGGETWENVDAGTFVENDLWDDEVTLLASPSGMVAGLIFGTEGESTKNYGVITNVNAATTLNSAGDEVLIVKILKSDSEKYSHSITEDTFIKVTNNGSEVLASTKIKNLASPNNDVLTAITYYNTTYPNAVIAFSLASDGTVGRIEFIDNTDTTGAALGINTDENLVTIAGKSYNAEDVVVFNRNNDKALGWKELKNIEDATPIYAWKTNSSSDLQYIVLDQAGLSSDTLFGIFSSKSNAADDWITFVGQDALVWDNYSAAFGFASGDIVAYVMDGGEVDTLLSYPVYDYSAQKQLNATMTTYTVTKISGYVLTVSGGTTFDLDADTVYFDVYDKDAKKVLENKSGISQGDKVILFGNDGAGGIVEGASATGALDVVAVVR